MNKARFPGKSVNKHIRPTVSFSDIDYSLASESEDFNQNQTNIITELPVPKKQLVYDEVTRQDEFHGFSPNDNLRSVCNTKRAQLTSLLSTLGSNDRKVNGLNSNTFNRAVRVRSKRIADRSAAPTKRKYPFESPEEPRKEIKNDVVTPNNEFKTPVKIGESIDVRQKATMLSAVVSPAKIETVVKTAPELSSFVEASSVQTAPAEVKNSTSIKISNDFFKEKEEFVASVIVVTPNKLNQNYESLKQVKGLLHCGVCLSITECDNLGPLRKNGAFLCLKCIGFYQKMLKIAKKATAFSCRGQGACEIIPGTDYCEACFVRSCLLLLDMSDDIYFKMWRAVPPIARNWVPTKPPVAKRYSNRGKVVYANEKDGSILSVCAFKNCRSENSNGASTHTNGKSKGVKRLFPNDEKSLTRVTGPRVKQVSRRVSGRPQIATFEDEMEITRNNNITEEPNKEILLDRLVIEKKMIKVHCPLDSYEVERNGYPIIVPDGEEQPNKPLCFVCGSAGIKQLIFCSACCEPFHPYCADDSLLLSAFIIQTVNETKNEVGKGSDCNCNEDCQNSCSSCTPALRMFRKWKCMECVRCKSCHKGTISCNMSTENEFIKCVQCLDSYHILCVKKATNISMKTNDVEKWMCQNCLKCTSCGVRLSKSFQNNFRNLSTDDNRNGQEREMLCLECFKRRQKGSFCPVCLVCYDDNDWDSKMMECDRCARWIHSKCEGLNDEQYFILSSLPETVAYICRLCCCPENEAGWRHAVKAELSDGFTKALDIFQKKVVGMSRKRRALTFDEELDDHTSYFKPDVNVVENQNPTEVIHDIVKTSFKEENNSSAVKTVLFPDVKNDIDELYLKFNLKSCVVKLIDMDVTKRASVSPKTVPDDRNNNNGTRTIDNFPVKIEVETTPVKVPSSPLKPEPNQGKKLTLERTPVKISTPTRIVTSFTDSILSMRTFWTSVQDFRGVCLKLLPSYFLEIDATSRFEEYFEDSVKQVFPWFKIPELNELLGNSTTPPESIELKTDAKRAYSPVLNTVEMETSVDADIVCETNCFEEVFWDSDNFMDYRECLFCKNVGDFPPNSCGRLLYIGPAEWVHVNCAIWSSEVWEEDSGGLQQVEIAVARSKRISCSFCDDLGATLTCCAATCRRCYHFLCAIEAGCSLMEDKTVFCPVHEAAARGQLQTDMHVMRKVFVDMDLSRKKEVRFLSKDVKAFIGSMRIEKFGQLYPISFSEINSSKFLTPVGYICGRLFWSQPNTKQLELCWLGTSVKREGDFRKKSETIHTEDTYSLVVDHTKRRDWIHSKLLELQDFFHWVGSAPRFVDEYDTEWLLPYNQLSSDIEFKTFKRKNGYTNKQCKKVKITGSSATKHPCVVKRATIEWEVKVSKNSGKLSEYGIGKPCGCYLSDKIHFPSGIFTTSQEESLFMADKAENSYKFFISKIGLLHPGIRYLIEQLPGVEDVAGKYDFHFHNPIVLSEDTPVKVNFSGCARTEGFRRRKPFDMFGWLASRHRKAPAPLRMFEETVKSKGLPIAMRYRNLKERAVKDLVVLPSHIHGRGLFARRDIEIGEMLIEYAGEAIRSPVCDVRERKYETEGMGCYMFRIDRDLVIDATMKGNAARFINHSCDPNCESKSVKILGKGHILIFALKNIGRGEELTYDYKFEREADKLPCSCSAKKCRKFLN